MYYGPTYHGPTYYDLAAGERLVASVKLGEGFLHNHEPGEG